MASTPFWVQASAASRSSPLLVRSAWGFFGVKMVTTSSLRRSLGDEEYERLATPGAVRLPSLDDTFHSAAWSQIQEAKAALEEIQRPLGTTRFQGSRPQAAYAESQNKRKTKKKKKPAATDASANALAQRFEELYGRFGNELMEGVEENVREAVDMSKPFVSEEEQERMREERDAMVDEMSLKYDWLMARSAAATGRSEQRMMQRPAIPKRKVITRKGTDLASALGPHDEEEWRQLGAPQDTTCLAAKSWRKPHMPFKHSERVVMPLDLTEVRPPSPARATPICPAEIASHFQMSIGEILGEENSLSKKGLFSEPKVRARPL